jgi:hypothetical protein
MVENTHTHNIILQLFTCPPLLPNFSFLHQSFITLFLHQIIMDQDDIPKIFKDMRFYVQAINHRKREELSLKLKVRLTLAVLFLDM